MENSGRFKKGLIPWSTGTKGIVKPNSGSFTKGNPPPPHKEGCSCFRHGGKPWNKGITYKIHKISASKGKHYYPAGEFKKKPWTFKGTRNEYRNLHKRVCDKFEKSDTCEICGKDNLKGKQIHWASKNGIYNEDRENWIRLCARCHWFYDHRDVFDSKGRRK
jgi:hypothetical protein